MSMLVFILGAAAITAIVMASCNCTDISENRRRIEALESKLARLNINDPVNHRCFAKFAVAVSRITRGGTECTAVLYRCDTCDDTWAETFEGNFSPTLFMPPEEAPTEVKADGV